jgi:hypothetical protein
VGCTNHHETQAEDEAVAMDEFLATVDKLAKAPDPFELTADIDSFSKISRESKQLIEIIDIRDELDIIKSVLTTQKRVLKQLRDVIRSQGKAPTLDNGEAIKTVVKTIDMNSGKAAGDTAFKSTVVVEDAIRIVEDNLLRVDEMDGSATRVHAEVSIHTNMARWRKWVCLLTPMIAQAAPGVQATTSEWMGGPICKEDVRARAEAEYGASS